MVILQKVTKSQEPGSGQSALKMCHGVGDSASIDKANAVESLVMRNSYFYHQYLEILTNQFTGPHRV